MASTNPLLVVDGSCAGTLGWLQECLSRAGLQAVQTFDLRDAHLATIGCTCPHHRTATCDCQMVVLLVYGGGERPASLMLHSNGGRTWVSLVDTSAQPVDGSTRSSIEKALQVNYPRESL